MYPISMIIFKNSIFFFFNRLNFRMLAIQCLLLGRLCAYLRLYLGIHKEVKASNLALSWAFILIHHNSIPRRYVTLCISCFLPTKFIYIIGFVLMDFFFPQNIQVTIS